MKRLLTTVLLALPLLLLSCTKGGEGMVITPPSNTKPSSGSDSETQTPTTPQTPETPGTLCTDIGQTPIVLAYFTEYTETLPEVSLLTHINYAHGRFKNPSTGDGGIVITESKQAPISKVVALKSVNPKLKVIFTVSPIRHKRDGYHVNQLSKGVLLQAVDEMGVEYFPSYEIMMDELRDYRFYADDMIHPSEKAVEYIWRRFQDTYMDNKTRDAVARATKEWARQQHRQIVDS